MIKVFTFSVFILSICHMHAQLSVAGTYDGYAAFSKKGITSLPFMVSHSKMATYDINLLELELRYTKKDWAFQFSPAVGSYMQNNYALESPYRRFLYESYLQYKKGKNEWAAGTFSSPYTQETPRAVDQLLPSRSLSAEYVPYYVSGLRWTHQWKANFKTQFFVTNGWQRLAFSGARPSLGMLLQWEFKKWKWNWSHFYGDVAPIGKLTPELGLNRWRFFQELNCAYQHNNWTLQSCAYLGAQNRNGEANLSWWGQANLQASYAVRQGLAAFARVEFFYDPNSVVFSDDQSLFSSSSVGWMQLLGPTLQVGQEFRYFLGKQTNIPVLYSFLRLKF
jgi:hypothetical protein